MKTTIITLILFMSFALKSHLYVFTIFEVISSLEINSIQDIFEIFGTNKLSSGFFVGALIQLVIIYYTLKLKTLILKKIITAPIVIRIVKQLRDIALYIYHRYTTKVV